MHWPGFPLSRHCWHVSRCGQVSVTRDEQHSEPWQQLWAEWSEWPPTGLVSLQPLSLPDYNITSSTAISEQHSVKYSTHNPYIVRWLIGDTISASHLSHPGPCYSTPSPGGRQSQNFSWDNILKILLVFIIKFSHNSSLFIRNWLTLTNPNSVQLMNFDSILTFPNQIYIFRYVLWPPRYYQPIAETWDLLWICKKCRVRSNCLQQRPLCMTNVEDIPHHYPPPIIFRSDNKKKADSELFMVETTARKLWTCEPSLQLLARAPGDIIITWPRPHTPGTLLLICSSQGKNKTYKSSLKENITIHYFNNETQYQLSWNNVSRFEMYFAIHRYPAKVIKATAEGFRLYGGGLL